MARLNGWPINSPLQLFAILIICNYLTDRAVQPPKGTHSMDWYSVRTVVWGHVNACISATMFTSLCLWGERREKNDNNARLIVSYPILCVAFSMIRYILYVHSLTHLLTLLRCDTYIYYLYHCQHKYNPWLTTTHCHRIWYCCVFAASLCLVIFFFLLPTFVRFVACFYFIECVRNIWNWLWPPKVEFHLYMYSFSYLFVRWVYSFHMLGAPLVLLGGIVPMCAVCSCMCVRVLMFYFCTLRNKQ